MILNNGVGKLNAYFKFQIDDSNYVVFVTSEDVLAVEKKVT